MDLDIMFREVQQLKAFRDRVEPLLPLLEEAHRQYLSNQVEAASREQRTNLDRDQFDPAAHPGTSQFEVGGTVWRRSAPEPAMTVTAVTPDSVSATWTDQDGEHQENFPLDDLVTEKPAPRQEAEAGSVEIKAGDTVWLSSGSPKMTVVEVDDDGALCAWTDPDGARHEDVFEVDELTIEDKTVPPNQPWGGDPNLNAATERTASSAGAATADQGAQVSSGGTATSSGTASQDAGGASGASSTSATSGADSPAGAMQVVQGGTAGSTPATGDTDSSTTSAPPHGDPNQKAP